GRVIHRLTQVARRVAAGDLDARLYLSAAGEVGELAQAFNHMADRLRAQVGSLDDQRQRLEAVLENMADGVLITDEYGQVSLINPAAERLLGLEEGAAAGRSFAQVARHHQLIALWQRACAGPAGEQTAAVELERRGAFVQMIVTPLAAAEPRACLIILQDLTRVRRLESMRRDFISNISHELRTPLASLKALVETVRDTALDDPPAAARFLSQADQEVDHLAQVVAQLLELARVEAGQAPLQLRPVQLKELLRPALERLRPQAMRQQLRLEVAIPAGLPAVLADPARIEQVAGNLVHNAIKFTPAGGRVRLSAELDEKGRAAVVAVSDTGVGIPAAELGRIFERFYKADRARSGGGAGLGLAIARHLVQAHGGRIWAKSKEGKGSVFYFSLPLAGQEAGEEAGDN
ncbi:MAG: sensor histidine kinase, partial [Candidatus Promineifilaceae bacterium]